LLSSLFAPAPEARERVLCAISIQSYQLVPKNLHQGPANTTAESVWVSGVEKQEKGRGVNKTVMGLAKSARHSRGCNMILFKNVMQFTSMLCGSQALIGCAVHGHSWSRVNSD
jgi:hypothetical protein